MPETLELVGTITKLEDGFAFARTDAGTVFIPISAARLNKDTMNSLKEKFSYQDEVNLTVQKQAGKNSCKFVALKVKKSNNSSTSGSSRPTSQLSNIVYGPYIAQVTSTTESYAFARHEEYGTIFVPGEAFDSSAVRRVSGYVSIGSQLIVSIKEQKEKNGCKWIAVTAVRHFDVEPEQEDGLGDRDVIVSCATVMEIGEMKVEAWDETHKVMVNCPQLTYVGGLRGRAAKTLRDLIDPNENIMYKARLNEGNMYDAIEWRHIADADTLQLTKKCATTVSSTQTAPCLLSLIVKTMFREQPGEMVRYERFLDRLPDAALPDSYLVQRDRKKYESGGWDV